MTHFFLKFIFAFSHYEDWNEVWQGDQAQGRKGFGLTLLSSATSSAVLSTNERL